MKQVLCRIGIGAAVGIMIGYFVTLIVSICIGSGDYMPVMPALSQRCTTMLQAVLLQTLYTALIGIVFAIAGMLFLIDRWSFLKQCIIHFLSTVIFYLPFSVMCWFPMHWNSVVGIIGSVLMTYSITFFVNYAVNKRIIRGINEQVRRIREDFADDI